MLKNLPQMSLNYLKKKAIQKTLEVTGDLIDNKISDEITKFSETSPQNKSATVESKIEMPKKDIHFLKKYSKSLIT